MQDWPRKRRGKAASEVNKKPIENTLHEKNIRRRREVTRTFLWLKYGGFEKNI